MDKPDVYSGYGNDILYRMCQEKPNHDDVDVIHGKLWLIGRTYSVAVERGAGEKVQKYKNEKKDYVREYVCPRILKSGIDDWISKVSYLKSITTAEDIHNCLGCHKKLTDLFHDITGLYKRSLASKYLHFHHPKVFFIYDSIAVKRISELVTNKNVRRGYLKGYDNEYSNFVNCCLFFRDKRKRETGKELSPRQLDSILLEYPVW